MTITEQEIRKRLGDHLGRASDALSTFLANEQNTSTVTKSSAKKGKGSNKKRSRSELLKDSNIVESADSSCAALNLFEKLQSVHLIITFNRPPEDRLEPTICVLPHSPLKVGSDESPSAFLLVKYPQRKAKDIVASSDKLRSIIKKVSDEDKFRKKFATHELRRRLCHSFQLLLVDKRIVPAYIPLMFGKAALSHNRIPIAISVHESIPNLERDLEAACRSAVIVFRGQRTLNVCLGYTSVLTSGSFIAQNALCILKEILNAENLLQRGWMDIESIALEDASSRARLLVYAHDYSEEREWMKNNMSELDEISETVLVQKNSQPSSDSNEFEDDSDLDCDDGKVDVPQMSSPKSSQSARQNKKVKVVGKTEKIEMNSKGSPKSPKKGMNSTSSSSVIHSRVKKVK